MRTQVARLTLMFCATTFGACSLYGEPDAGVNQIEKTFQRTITVEEKLDYLLFLPAGYDPKRPEGWPLILFLHGVGERGADLSRVKAHGPPKLVENDPDFPFVVVSPQCPEDALWQNSSLLGLLDEIIANHNIDTNRVYLTGLSMGGFGTWNLGLVYPERFAAIAPICGGGQPISVDLAGDKRRKDLQTLPVWAFHGAKDPVVPLEESQRMVEALKRIGGSDVKLTVYPEVGHDSWTQTYSGPELYEWMLDHKREP